MGRWRNKWENEPAQQPKKRKKQQANVDYTAGGQVFNERLFDPANALIEHADKLELQTLAEAAAKGDPSAVQAYYGKIYDSGLLQEEKDALANMFTYTPPKKGRGNRNIRPTVAVAKEPPAPVKQPSAKERMRNRYNMNGPGAIGRSAQY